MFILVKNYVEKMTKEDCLNFALSNDINLNDNELDFVYNFIKKNYKELLTNPDIDLARFKSNFSDENFVKINTLVNKLKQKYAYLLR